jgi:hypothetical protein
MDQDTVVSEQTESGKRLIAALTAKNFDVPIAFWAKLSEEGKWYLFLASSVVDDQGPASAYRLVFDVLRDMPEIWIDPFEIKVVGIKDSLTQAAFAVTKPKVPNGKFAVPNPKPYPGMTRFGGPTLGGISIDGAYIYPPAQPSASA